MLQHEASNHKAHFLDLKIQVVGGRLVTTTHFKETDRNGFIPMSTCQHPSWLNGVLRSQFHRIRLNCATLKDVQEQALILKSRFIEKGYIECNIDRIIGEVGEMDREQMLQNQATRDDMNTSKFSWSTVTNFSTQHFAFKRI